MTVAKTRVTVAEDRRISGSAPEGVPPPGEHEAVITLAVPVPAAPGKPFTMEDFPTHDEPWDASVSLRREDMYGAEGRLRRWGWASRFSWTRTS